MKIRLKELVPNPFKKFINKGELNEEKITQLKESIDKDGFWDNVLCRKKDGKYELAYGHHRVEAAKQVLGKDYEIDIPCRGLSDEAMLRILGNENNTTNEVYAIYQIDQVVTTKRFLEEHPEVILKCPSAGQIRDRKKEIDSIRAISWFLGEKNWSKSKVADLLKLAGSLHPKILDDLRNAPRSSNYEGISKTHGIHLSQLPDKKDQLKAYEIIKKHSLNKEQTGILVKNMKENKTPQVPDLQRKIPDRPTIERAVIDSVKKLHEVMKLLESIIPHRKDIKKGARLLLDVCLDNYRKQINKYFEQEV